MKEEDEINDRNCEYRSTQYQLVIGPDQLSRQPKCATERQQHPEGVLAPIRRRGVPEQAGIGEKGDKAHGDVAKCLSAIARRYSKRHGRVAADEEGPGSQKNPGCSSRFHIQGQTILSYPIMIDT